MCHSIHLHKNYENELICEPKKIISYNIWWKINLTNNQKNLIYFQVHGFFRVNISFIDNFQVCKFNKINFTSRISKIKFKIMYKNKIKSGVRKKTKKNDSYERFWIKQINQLNYFFMSTFFFQQFPQKNYGFSIFCWKKFNNWVAEI